MKLITRINEKISIWADTHQYTVRIKKNRNQREKHAEVWYLPTLDVCFTEIFDYLCKEQLANGKDKSLKEIAKIILEIKEEILKIMEPFVDLRSGQTPDLKARQATAKSGKKPHFTKKV